MRVLHVITGLDAGGAEQSLRTLLRHTRHDAEVLALTNAGVLARAIAADGIRVSCLEMRGNRDVAALPRLVAHVRRGRYDVVHTHLFRAQLFGALAARAAGVRLVVSTEHSLNPTHIEGRPTTRAGVRALYRIGARCTTRTVAVSRPVARLLAGWGVDPARTVVIPLGIDRGTYAFDPVTRREVRARLRLPPDATVVGGVGRLVPGKRFDVLLDAVAAIPAAHLLLLGAGPERAALAARAAELGIADRTHFAGEVPHVAPSLAAMDVFASPSPEETFGLAVVEALAAGLPAVHVRCPALEGLGDVPGVTTSGPAAAEFAAALRYAIDTRPAGRPVPAAVDRFDAATAARAIDDLYEELARAGRNGHRAVRPRAGNGRTA